MVGVGLKLDCVSNIYAGVYLTGNHLQWTPPGFCKAHLAQESTFDLSFALEPPPMDNY